MTTKCRHDNEFTEIHIRSRKTQEGGLMKNTYSQGCRGSSKHKEQTWVSTKISSRSVTLG